MKLTAIAFTGCLMVFAGLAFAQEPLQTLYYPSGSKAVEGHWRMTSTAFFSTGYFERSQQRHYPDNVEPNVFTNLGRFNDAFERVLLNLHPEGLVTTWYERGGKQKELTFADGVAAGPYTEYYWNGKIAQQGNLERGMPSGRWTAYDITGAPYYTGSYVPFTDNELAQRWQTLVRPIDNSSEVAQRRSYWKKNFIEAQSDTLDNEEMLAIRPILQTFSGISPGMMSKREGTFRFYHRHNKGGPLAVLCYRNNVRDSIWSFWESTEGGAPTYSLEYRLGVLLSIRDSTGKHTVAQYVAAQKAAEERARKKAERIARAEEKRYGTPVFGIIAEAPPPEIIKFADQRAAFRGDIKLWLKANQRYPLRARSGRESCAVTVYFLIAANGKVSDEQVVDTDGDECKEFEAEALRLMGTMPEWIPAKINGRAIPVYHRLTISFKPDARMK